jgi:hypothetical protein
MRINSGSFFSGMKVAKKWTKFWFKNQHNESTTMKNNWFLTMTACVGFAAAAQATDVTIDFQNHGTGNLGVTTDTFSDGGASIVASGFSATGPVDLWVKSGSPSETGLGLANDTTDHEILPGSFIQLTVPPAPPGSTLKLVVTGSIQSGESVEVFFGATSGTIGSTPITGGSVSGDQQTFLIPAGDQSGFIDVTAGAGNILLDSAVVTIPNVPDGGLTIALLGGALTALGLARRKLTL